MKKTLTIADCKKRLKEASDPYLDDEVFHSIFDDLLEEKLLELDPKWMKAMHKIYDDSGSARWCA